MVPKNEWSALRVRMTFIDYFKNHGHTFGINPLLQMPLSFETHGD